MNKQFSARLGKAIEAMGLNPTNFAYKARVPQGTISKCLHGHVPTAKLLLRISKTSGKSVDWLLTGKEQSGTGKGYVAESAASYGRRKAAGSRKTKADEKIWIAKLLKVLRSGSRREKQTVKDLLDVLSR
jgi:hypothetical protein